MSRPQLSTDNTIHSMVLSWLSNNWQLTLRDRFSKSFKPGEQCEDNLIPWILQSWKRITDSSRGEALSSHKHLSSSKPQLVTLSSQHTKAQPGTRRLKAWKACLLFAVRPLRDIPYLLCSCSILSQTTFTWYFRIHFSVPQLDHFKLLTFPSRAYVTTFGWQTCNITTGFLCRLQHQCGEVIMSIHAWAVFGIFGQRLQFSFL